MDHETAIRLQAAERYVSGELPETERDQFEEHFFECAICAEEVSFEQIFAANTRAVLREEAAVVPAAALPHDRVTTSGKAGSWFSLDWLSLGWLRPAFAASAFANVALLALGCYQALQVVPHLRAQLEDAETPQLTAAIAVPTLVRGDAKLIQVPASVRVIPLSFALPRPFSQYAYELSQEGGKVRISNSVPAPAAAAEELLLAVPTAKLEAGIYRVVFSGLDGSNRIEIGSCRLQVQR